MISTHSRTRFSLHYSRSWGTCIFLKRYRSISNILGFVVVLTQNHERCFSTNVCMMHIEDHHSRILLYVFVRSCVRFFFDNSFMTSYSELFQIFILVWSLYAFLLYVIDFHSCMILSCINIINELLYDSLMTSHIFHRKHPAVWKKKPERANSEKDGVCEESKESLSQFSVHFLSPTSCFQSSKLQTKIVPLNSLVELYSLYFYAAAAESCMVISPNLDWPCG